MTNGSQRADIIDSAHQWDMVSSTRSRTESGVSTPDAQHQRSWTDYFDPSDFSDIDIVDIIDQIDVKYNNNNQMKQQEEKQPSVSNFGYRISGPKIPSRLIQQA